MGVIIPQVVTEDKASGALVVDGSLKFDKNKSQRLQFTPSNSGNRRTWTISYWYKNTNFANTGRQFQAGTSNPDFFLLGYHSLGYIQCTDWSTNWFRTGALLRDTGWYHIVLAWDTTQVTNTERWKFYINGVRQNSWTDSGEHLNYPSQDSQQAVNKASVVHQLGSNTANSQYTDGHMAQVYFIDGQALDPSYFGYTDALTNTWRPKKAKITLGSVWSNYFTDIGIIDDGALTNVFDGNTATQFEFNSTGGNGVFRPPNPIPYSTSIELFSSRTLGGNTVSVNGGSTVSYGGNAWVTVASGPGTLTSLTFYNGTAGNQRIHAIRIDGNILTNTSGAIDAGANGYYLPLDGNTPIGQDRSGRGNNWTPVNFGGSNTLEKATGALPILNTDGGGKVARVGVRTDSAVGVGVTCILALPLVGIKSDFSNQVDSRSSNKAITEGGGIAGITTISNFYGGSYRFDGSDDYLSLTLGSMASTNHTIEFWMYTPDASSLMTVFEMGTGSNGDLQFILNSGAVNYGTSGSAKTSTAYVANKWYHVALVFDGTYFKTFLDGVQVSSYTQSYSISSATNLYIGRRDQNQFPFKGYLQDFRIYQGIKYTQNFIPASTDPDILPDTPSGVAYSSNVALVPSTDGGSVAFDPDGDYLKVPASSDLSLTGDFTIEMFIYMSGTEVNMRQISSDGYYTVGKNGNWYFGLNATDTNEYIFYTYDGQGNEEYVNINLPETPALNKWYHLAAVRSGTTVTLYLDGINVGSNTISKQLVDGANSGLVIGKISNGSGGSYGDHIGFISNVHIVKGTALYTSNFTPPTGPISSVANTKLLCCKSQTSARAFSVVPGNGVIYSNYATGYTASGYTVDKVFDTDTTNYNVVTTSASFTFTPPTPISYSSSIVVKVNTGGGSPMAFNVNGAGFGSYNLYNGDQEVTVVSGSGTLSSLAIAVNAGGGANFYYIKVDGNVLYDPISVLGNAAATNFNPFTVNINTQRGQESGYCTWNPLSPVNATYSNGNLDVTPGSNGRANGNVSASSGKWYWEALITASSATPSYNQIGIGNINGRNESGVATDTWMYRDDARKINSNSTSVYGSTYTIGDVIGVAWNADSGDLTFYKNGISQGVAYTGISGTYGPVAGRNSNPTMTFATNFGQKPFKFPPPAGFQPLALANTPRPTIVRPDQYVGVTTYLGNATARSINIGFKPDLVWIKHRGPTDSGYHIITDSVRGVNSQLYSNATDTQGTFTDRVTSFDSSGFSLASNVTTGGVNGNGYNYVAWTWKAGGNSNTYNINDIGYSTASAAGLSAGTITPSGASVNTKSGFSIITYTGNGGDGATISHGLGKTPSLFMIKSRSLSQGWRVFHTSLGATGALHLNSTTAFDENSGFFNNTSPNSTTFTLGSGVTVNSLNATYVAYLWAEIPGFSKFGSYTGNGSSTDGAYVSLGFRPKFILFKATSGAENWDIYDSTRNSYNLTNLSLQPNLSGLEYNAGSIGIDFLSNGFKLIGGSNTNGVTYIYAAFAETPSFNLYGGQANAR